MRTLVIITLIGVIILAGNAAAFVEPIAGQTDKYDAEGQYVTMWVNDRQWDNVTISITNGDPYPDLYSISTIAPLLTRAGVAEQSTYNLTVAMYCSGNERALDGTLGAPYTNTYHNETGTTLYGVKHDGNAKYPPMLNIKSCAAEETFSKPLYEGWNLISLSLVPGDSSASSVLASVWENVTAVYRYNATSKQFERANAMEPGTGYYVHATSECTWTYSGTAYTSMDVSLEPGLNMVGWLNCLMDIDAISSISGDYYYVACWNTSAEKFDVYNPVAPSVFNDFKTMDRGTGYFISTKQECTLSESC